MALNYHVSLVFFHLILTFLSLNFKDYKHVIL